MYYLLLGILFIIGGASGQYVLRGTNSGPALAVLGVGLVIFGIVSLVQGSAKKQKAKEAQEQTAREAISSSAPLAAPCRVEVFREKRVIGAAMSYPLSLNGTPLGELKNGAILLADTYYENNVLSSEKLPGTYSFQAAPGSVVRLKFLGAADKEGNFFQAEAGLQPQVRTV